MVAKDGVNQASALVLTRWETAQSLGVADRAIFLHGHGTGSEPQVLNRSSMGQSESMAAAYRDALAGAGIEAEQLGAADLYSCFPIAVWVAMDALGMQLDDPRPLTLTGGLPFFGGPGNNYSTHGIAEMVHWLRAQPAPSYGAVGANGGYLSKHAVGVYANIPAEFPRAAPEFKAPESVEVVSDPEPIGVIESYTFQWQKDAPRAVIVGRQVSDGRRWVGVADPEDAELLAWFEKADPLGERVEVSAGERNIVRRRGQ
jgi:acetyl-CoA C-acetyltransferase